METTFNALVVEDEELAQELLQSYIAKTPWIECVGVCDNAMQASSLLHAQTKVDIIFLDIHLPEMSGLEFLRVLDSLRTPAPAVILSTAHSEYALDGYELGVVDYLLKPFSFDRYMRAINKATTLLRAAGEPRHEAVQSIPQDMFVMVKERKGEVPVPYGEILFLESFGNYVKIHTAKRWYTVHRTLKSFEEILPTDDFFRIHKTTIVAKKAIQDVKDNVVYIGNHTLPIGITYRHEAKNLTKGLST